MAGVAAKGQETLLENLDVALGSLEEGQRGGERGLCVCGPLPEPRPGSMWLPACIPPPGAFQKLGLLAGAGLCGWGMRPWGHQRLQFQDCGFGDWVSRLCPGAGGWGRSWSWAVVGLVGQGGPAPRGPFGIKAKLQGPVRSCIKIKVKGISLSTALAPSPLNLTIGCETSSGWSFWTIFKPEWPHTWPGCPSQTGSPVLAPWAPNVKTTQSCKTCSRPLPHRQSPTPEHCQPVSFSLGLGPSFLQDAPWATGGLGVFRLRDGFR